MAVRKRDLTWGFPGGSVESDETMEDTLKNKVKDQTNVDIRIDSLLFCKERRTEWEHVCTFVFKASAKGDFQNIRSGDSIFRAKWLSIPSADDLIKLDNLVLNKLIFEQGVLYENRNEFPVR
nr:NUDIX hydrolase [Listeria ilorinensis]